ncbi:MAG: Hpt domain-containing protein, partial [Spirochaetia bacterium]|nr:Hpt domain-containing protein [Spirochaetia bacterium]
MKRRLISFSKDELETYQAFAVESCEALNDVEVRILRLAEDACEIAPIFRALHTVKGNSGFVNLPEFTQLSHHLENLFDFLRQKKLAVTPELTDLFLENVDILTQMISGLRQALASPAETGSELQIEIDEIDICEGLQKLESHLAALGAGSVTEAPDPVKITAPPLSREQHEVVEEIVSHAPRDGDSKIKVSPDELKAVFGPDSQLALSVDLQLETGKKEEVFAITDEMWQSFHKEAGESLGEIEQLLLEQEKNLKDKLILLDMFRLLHSFKGNCGFFGLGEMEALSHRLESAL